MEFIQDKNSRKGLIGTVLFHLLLLLLFLFVGMAYPDPPPPEEGITINFGTSDEGMGEEQPENPSETSENIEQENTETTTAASNVAEEQVITQNTTETINVNASENTTQESETVVEEESTSQNLSEALNAFNNNSSSTNANEGETGNPGDQGSLDGDPNSPNHNGGPVGKGVTYSLAGRSLMSTPKIDDNSQEQGKVVVDIVVDKTGKVIKATPGGRGSTTTSPLLYKKALEAALKTKFNAKPDLVGDQKGQMTFVFILN
jgi:TonB family protein